MEQLTSWRKETVDDGVVSIVDDTVECHQNHPFRMSYTSPVSLFPFSLWIFNLSVIVYQFRAWIIYRNSASQNIHSHIHCSLVYYISVFYTGDQQLIKVSGICVTFRVIILLEKYIGPMKMLFTIDLRILIYHFLYLVSQYMISYKFKQGYTFVKL